MTEKIFVLKEFFNFKLVFLVEINTDHPTKL